MRGKVQCENFEIKKARLKELMRIKNPSAVEKAEIRELENPVKNYERSLGMNKCLEDAGIVNSPEENMRIAKQLISDASKLDVANGVKQETESILEGPNGKMVMVSDWILQDDGCWYLATVKLKYINGEG